MANPYKVNVKRTIIIKFDDQSYFYVQWRKYRRKLMDNKHQEMPWLMMLSAADYRKNHINTEWNTSEYQ